MRALCVLTLLFLNFGHVAPVSAGDLPLGVSSYAAATICQEPAQDDPQTHHAPCHACRIGAGADLPPPPCLVERAFAELQHVGYAEPARRVSPRPFAHILGSRAPPLV